MVGYTHSNLRLTVQLRFLSFMCTPGTLSASLWNRQMYSSDSFKHCPDISAEKKYNTCKYYYNSANVNTLIIF